jgi:zinc transport system substrate-binding protein
MRRCWLVPLVVLALLAAGCGGSATPTFVAPGGAARATGDGRPQVVAAVYPLAWLAEQIAPDAEVILLNRGGLEAHDLDLSPPQRAAIETADVVLYVGDIDYQPQVEEAVSSAQGQLVSATEAAGDDALLTASADAREAGGIDPHLWFDPSIMAEVATATGEAFAAADPDNAEAYRQNAAAVSERLGALRDDLDATLGRDCAFDEAIVSHAAYAYLLAPYGKAQRAVTNVNAEDDASAGGLGEIVGEIREEGFTYVLAEPVEGREGAEAVATEAGVELLEVSPLDAVSDEQAAAGLPDLVRAQAETFATALGCA